MSKLEQKLGKKTLGILFVAVLAGTLTLEIFHPMAESHVGSILNYSNNIKYNNIVVDPWLNGFSYRKAITVTNSLGSTLSNYQVNMTLDTSTPIAAGKMQSGCQDIRVTDSDGVTVLNHWMEGTCNTGSTKVWAKVPSIPSGSKTIYVYYGNTVAVNRSSGDNTFVLFDDFNSGSLNASKWTTYTQGTGSATVSNGVLNLSPTGSTWYGVGVYSAANFTKRAYTMDMRWNPVPASSSGCQPNDCGADGPYFRDSTNYRETTFYGTQSLRKVSLWINAASGSSSSIERADSSSGFSTAVSDSLVAGTDYDISFRVNSTNAEYRLNGVLKGTSGVETSVWNSISDPMKFELYHSEANLVNTHKIDYFRVREYAPVEPTTSAGSEESLTTPAGTPFSWSWKVPVPGDKVRYGTPTSWTWTTFQDDGTTITVPRNTTPVSPSTLWSWGP